MTVSSGQFVAGATGAADAPPGPALSAAGWRQSVARASERTTFAAALLVFALAAVPYGSVEPWWESAFACAAFILGAVWMAEGLVRECWGVRGARLLLPVACLSAFALLQTVPLPLGEDGSWTVASANTHETRRFVLKLAATAIWGAVVLRSVMSPRRLRTLICVVVCVVVASSLFGIARQAVQQTGGAAGFGLGHLTPRVGYGQFINRNHFALLMEVGLGLGLGFIAGGGVRSRLRLLPCLAGLAPVCGALVLTNSRGGLFSMLAQFACVAVTWAVSRRGAAATGGGAAGRTPGVLKAAAWAGLTACLAAGLLVGVVWLGGGPLVARLEMIPGEVRATAGDERAGVKRLEVWGATAALFTSHSFSGVGFGAYQTAITRTHDASGEWTPEAAHNEYLELLASGGGVGAALSVWFVAVLYGYVRRGAGSHDPVRRASSFGALAALVGVALHSAVEYGLHVPANSLALAAVIVVLAAAGDSQRWERAGEVLPESG